MSKKCKTCSGNVSGIESIPYMLIAGAIGSAVVAKKVDEMLTTNADDGTPKKNADGTPSYLVANPKIKNAAFLAAGIVGSMYADGNEIVSGLSIGAAVYGGYALAADLMTPAPGVAGMGYIPPASLGAVHVPGNAGYSPSSIGNYGRMPINKNGQVVHAAPGVKFSAA